VDGFVTKMIVENLSPTTTVESLSQLFSHFGSVRSISLATDVMTGRCGGFGFVRLHEQDAGAALSALNGKNVGGRVLRVTFEQKNAVSRDRRVSTPR
jgi:RNA recognition motif-containing protein